MPLRLLEVVIPGPGDRADEVREALDGSVIVDAWRRSSGPEGAVVDVLVEAEQSESVLDVLESRFGSEEGFRVVVLEAQATIPRPEEPEPDEDEVAAPERISREELYAEVQEMADPDTTYFALMGLAAVVAVIGLLLDSIAVVIGSMVIAPLLGPSVGLALSTTLADRDLAVRALKATVAGIGMVAAIAAVLGAILPVDPTIPQLQLRSEVRLWDVGLGLAVGGAGALSVTTGVSAALVGVMVAVALIPPLAAFGLLLGGGHFGAALGALLLLGTYLISINLTGVVTFAAQGIHPRRWWEAKQARRSTMWAMALWAGLLAALAGIIWWTNAI